MMNKTVHQWWDRRCVDGLDALLTPLEGIDVSDYERHTLHWLTGREDSTIAVVAALLHRARAAHPLPTQPPRPATRRTPRPSHGVMTLRHSDYPEGIGRHHAGKLRTVTARPR